MYIYINIQLYVCVNTILYIAYDGPEALRTVTSTVWLPTSAELSSPHLLAELSAGQDMLSDWVLPVTQRHHQPEQKPTT